MPPDPIQFTIRARSRQSRARLGRVVTPHGSFETPAFMPVGTKGTVKGLLPDLVRRTGSQVVLNNTYHLLLRPGPEMVEQLGGVHRFMGWNGPILTDSGGYQAYSMADINSIDEDGVSFRSIVDGRQIRLSPEVAIQVQNQLGADIIMAFDDCPPSIQPEGTVPANQTRLRIAVKRDSARKPYDHAARLRLANERTIRWLERCKKAHERSDRAGDQALFGIVQGGTDLDLRTWSAERVCAVDLPGYAIGGVAVGEPTKEISRIVRHTAALLPEAKPRYLMGVGYERDIVAAVLAGVDMFDCVLPTRNGRNANAFTRGGQIRLRNARFAEDPDPIERGCDCPACDPERHWPGSAPAGGKDGSAGFSRGYLRHLFLADEMLGPILVSMHNVRYFQRLMEDLRRTIQDDDWSGFADRWPQAAPGIGGLGGPLPAAEQSEAPGSS